MNIVKRIVGGGLSENQYSFMATLWLLEFGKYKFKCGGSYIGKNIILTAAHCIHNKDINKLEIRMGGNEIFNQKHSFKIKRVIIHNGFNITNLQNDIAILFLNKSPSNFGYKPINLSNNIDYYKLGSSLKVLGYGATTPNYNGHVDELKEIKVKIIPLGKTGYNNKLVTSNMILANDIINGKVCDACTGDSGGPAFKRVDEKDYLIGIVSWGSGCSKKNLPGVYTNVQKYNQWIIRVCGFDRKN